MAPGWFRRDDPAPPPPPDPLPPAFLALDQRLSVVAEGVGTAVALGQAPHLDDDFGRLRDRAYAAIEGYMAITGINAPVLVSAQQRDQVLAGLRDATADLDTFYGQHQQLIEGARYQLGQLPARATEVLRSADRELTGPGGGEAATEQRLRSVAQARDAVVAARETLREALSASSAPGMKRGADDLERTIGDLQAARAKGATIGDTTRAALTSVTTRRDAVALRQSRLPEVLSSLLREFSNECSRDLIGNGAAAEQHVTRAADLLDRARAAVAADPELAADLVGTAREELSDADKLVDAVSDRLGELRAVRTDPAVAEGKTRFRIRDAQLLARHNGLVSEWGSVLDAQSRRVDRAVAKLARTHPDYWGYLTELRSIDEFTAQTVAKMQGRK